MKTSHAILVGITCCVSWTPGGGIASTPTGDVSGGVTGAPESYRRNTQHTNSAARRLPPSGPVAVSGTSPNMNSHGHYPVAVGGPAKPGARTTMATNGSGITRKR